ncbi:histone deacetylase [Shewanella sp. A32]|uniref:histone deacetylase family protein n=1 Tax=Shewanella sp. A32 TaxID=3031327 RepID=UPI0023B97E93|nr:histone deacetylase [Shewanella sp. A32]MDF0533570.1 histone deacetylase [Shewanella sp. A32]
MIPVSYHASYSTLALPPHHRFPIGKYQALFHWLQQSDICHHFQIMSPSAIAPVQLCLVHDPEYIQQFINGTLPKEKMRRIGFPWSEALVRRTLHSLGGTLLATQQALEQRIAMQISGGYHHAYRDFGSGYCIFNDLVFAAASVISQGTVDRALIIDCDVHQGDGTANMTAGRDDIISCSIHCTKNFPARKQQSHYDLELPPDSNGSEYFELLQQSIPWILHRHQPQIIFYDAGVDVHRDDELGLLNLTTQDIYLRDKWILGLAAAKEIPIVCVSGGGYCHDTLQLISRHSQLYLAAAECFAN